MVDNTLLLSDILKSCQQFSFFHELLNLKQLEATTSEYLLNYDLIKIESTISDIINYLSSLLQIFQEISEADIHEKDTVNWLFEGKVEIIEIYRNLESIDDIISQLLVLLENKVVNSKNEQDNNKFFKTLESFDKIGDLSLRVKKFAIVYKKKLDIAILHDELQSQMIRGIDNELNECLKLSFKISELRISSPYRTVPNLNLEILHQKLSKNSSKTLKLPIFNTIDQSLYDQYLQLNERVKPLNMSLEFVPHALDNFKLSAKELYPDLIGQLSLQYDALKEKLGFLNKDLKDLKIELVDLRWTEIFTFLMTEIVFLLKDLEKEILISGVDQITKALNYKITIMELTLKVLQKADNLGYITDTSMTKEINQVDKGWNKLKKQLDNVERENVELDEKQKIEILSTVKKNYDSYDVLPNFMRKSQRIKDLEMLNAASPTKVNRKLAIGASLTGSMNLRPIYVDHTPRSTINSGKVIINHDELVELRNSDVANKLMKEADDSKDISSLTNDFAHVHLEHPKHKKVGVELSPINETSLVPTESLRALIDNNQDIKSKIPISSQFRNSVSFDRPQSRTSMSPPISRNSMPSPALTLSSMIPRPTSRCSSRLSSRASSRASSRGSMEIYQNSDLRVSRRSSSSSTTRLNLGNITNITNNGSNQSTPRVTSKRNSMLPTPIKGGIRRPESSLSNIVPMSKRVSINHDEFF